MDNKSIKKLEAELWESADLLRADSKLTSNQYCMPVLGLIFLRYAYSRFTMVEKEILSNPLQCNYLQIKNAVVQGWTMAFICRCNNCRF